MNKPLFYRWLSSISLLLLLSACAQTGQQPALEQPADYSIAAGKTQIAVRSNWWLQLRDPFLNDLVSQALQQSPNLKVATTRIEQMNAALGMADTAGKTQIGVHLSGASAYLTDKPESQRYDTRHSFTQGMLGLQGSWSFDFWGKNQALAASALGKKHAAEYELAQAKLMLAQAVVTQYAAWQNLDQQQLILKKRLENAQEVEKLLSQRIRAELLPQNAVYPIQQTQIQLQAQQQLMAGSIANARHALSVLCGQVPSTLDNRTPRAAAAIPILKTGRLLADILSRRPDIAAQKMLLSSRYQNVQATKAEFYPNIEIKAFVGLSHIDAFDVLKGTSKFVGVLPALNLPIFTSGALQSKLTGKSAEYNEQVARYNQTVLNALRDTADAVSGYQIRKSELALQQKAHELSKKQSASILRRVNVGVENKLVYLQFQDDVLLQQAKVALSGAELMAAWGNVHAQLGGGFYQE